MFELMHLPLDLDDETADKYDSYIRRFVEFAAAEPFDIECRIVPMDAKLERELVSLSKEPVKGLKLALDGQRQVLAIRDVIHGFVLVYETPCPLVRQVNAFCRIRG